MNDDCEFCRIVAGDRSAPVVYEGERTVAFLDQQPAVAGHCLIVPRIHETGLLTADIETATAIVRTVHTVSNALEDVLEPEGFSVFHTSGHLVGSVEHAHVHLVPRFADDDVALSLSRTGIDEELAADLTGRIRDAL
ncbi:HIT family protein [Natrialbaceae archaeon A-arb3/5]